MTSEALHPKINSSVDGLRLDVRIVTRGAAQLSAARKKTSARLHREIVLQKILLTLLLVTCWNLQNGDSLDKPLSRPKILIGLSGLQNASVAPLVTGHADVFRQPRGEFRGVDD